MEQKGYLHADGKVRQDRTEQTIGEVGLKTTRYNLRRALVVRDWRVILNDGTRFTGFSRRMDAVDAAYRHYLKNSLDIPG